MKNSLEKAIFEVLWNPPTFVQPFQFMTGNSLIICFSLYLFPPHSLPVSWQGLTCLRRSELFSTHHINLSKILRSILRLDQVACCQVLSVIAHPPTQFSRRFSRNAAKFSRKNYIFCFVFHLQNILVFFFFFCNGIRQSNIHIQKKKKTSDIQKLPLKTFKTCQECVKSG